MIAYGYSNCVACHVNPQGRSILTPYGNSIDEAQSLRAGEYTPGMGLSMWDGRVNQILRGYLSQSVTRKDKAVTKSEVVHFLSYQNATALTGDLTLAFGVDYRAPSETPSAVTPYYTTPRRDPWFLDYAYLKYAPVEGVAVMAGRDMLPTGINNTDAAQFIHARNALNNNERPVQVKAFWWTKSSFLSAYGYGANGDEVRAMRENGFGLLAETDLHSNRTVVGINLLNGRSDTADRQFASIYTRIGFAQKFGILTEYDHTWRRLGLVSGKPTVNQDAVLAQIFYLPMEWVAWYFGYEYLDVGGPSAFTENARAISGKLGLRLSRNFTLAASIRRSDKAHIATDVSQITLFAKF